MLLKLLRAIRAQNAPAATRRTTRPQLESLEVRLALSWSGIPPTTIPVPTASELTLDSQGDSTGNASIASNENDYYSFVAPVAGSYRFLASTPASNLDTVLGVFSASGSRIAYNDDISFPANLDSQVTVNLAAGSRYYFGITNYTGSSGGSYTWLVDGPVSTSNGFDIVVRYSGLTTSQRVIFEQAASRWEQIIVGDLPNATYRGVAVDDLLIDASSVSIDGAGGILGQAAPDAFRSGSSLPIHGVMQFDTADLASLQSSGTLLPVILHEMGHVLGIGTIWSTLGLLSGAGGTDPQFLGPRAITEYNALAGTNATGVPVEGLPAGPGTRDSHWRESVFGNELMTGYISGPINPLSRMTVASLADLGYTVNMAAADAYSLPSPPAVRAASTTTGGSTTTSRQFSLLRASWNSAGAPATTGAMVDKLLSMDSLDWLTQPTRRKPSSGSASLRGAATAVA